MGVEGGRERSKVKNKSKKPGQRVCIKNFGALTEHPKLSRELLSFSRNLHVAHDAEQGKAKDHGPLGCPCTSDLKPPQRWLGNMAEAESTFLSNAIRL